ncbi:hypothetical protein JRQ81_011899 [Phrynocephalus forsythii]|uniref:UDP-N-acetylglucosamine 4-epimerase n=1 Tax=Phrynocephalus forsythii TaxID=171643 RepID=A0A9Q1AQJ6_9SAUR|nr:hypothetical protein JRQ81_011899 [Phrynocephalus forsythii]
MSKALFSESLRKLANMGKGGLIGAAVGIGVTACAVPALLGVVGFTSGGIAAGSCAAKIMSASAIASGGGVPAGGTVAVLQSVGATGLAASTKAGVTAVTASVGAALGASKKSFHPLTWLWKTKWILEFQECIKSKSEDFIDKGSDMSEKILVTGGAGYIGSHCVLELVEAGYTPVVIDNFHNAIRGGDALPESIWRVQEIVRKDILFQELDVLDQAGLQELFRKHRFSAVIHFAGLKAVGESVQIPLEYYKVNLTGTIQLLETMKAHGVKNMVFSSSATVYGDPAYLPLDEKHPVGGCTNPYGKSKYFIEEMIRDLCKAEPDWNAILLRYFNPIGAHKSGRIGEDPQGIPNNLMPYVAQVAVGRREYLNVFGNDYNTVDGTGVRDYIHVVDLAKGHITALKKLRQNCGCKVYNLGTGSGYSVLQMVKAMEKASGREIKYKIVARREGDVAACYANAGLAERELDWKAVFGLDQMCEDLWRWQSQNPTGFSKN